MSVAWKLIQESSWSGYAWRLSLPNFKTEMTRLLVSSGPDLKHFSGKRQPLLAVIIACSSRNSTCQVRSHGQGLKICHGICFRSRAGFKQLSMTQKLSILAGNLLLAHSTTQLAFLSPWPSPTDFLDFSKTAAILCLSHCVCISFGDWILSMAQAACDSRPPAVSTGWMCRKWLATSHVTGLSE